jgi:uncharacterized protein (DUF2147 family)
MKNLFFGFFLVCAFSVSAQFTSLKGLTFIAKKIMYADAGEVKTEETYQVFNFSFIDKLMMHNILTDSKDSQIYKLQNIVTSYNESNKRTTFKVEAVSGLSGKTYNYEINIDDEGVAELSLNGYLYTGGSYKLKTYSQE